MQKKKVEGEQGWRWIEGNVCWNGVVGCTIMYRGYEGRDEFVRNILRLLLLIPVLLGINNPDTVRSEVVHSKRLDQSIHFSVGRMTEVRWHLIGGAAGVRVPEFIYTDADILWPAPQQRPDSFRPSGLVGIGVRDPDSGSVNYVPVYSSEGALGAGWRADSILVDQAAGVRFSFVRSLDVEYWEIGLSGPFEQFYWPEASMLHVDVARVGNRWYVIYSLDEDVFLIQNKDPLHQVFAPINSIKFYAPKIVMSANIIKNVGDLYDPLDGIEATWGYSTGRRIPSDGEIYHVDNIGLWDPRLTNTGEQYESIGVNLCTYEVRDTHALYTHSNIDNTVTTTSRTITVKTALVPTLNIVFNAAAVDAQPIPLLPNTQYNSEDLLTPSGGESGWTNQPLDITADPDTILGTFDNVLTVGAQPKITVTNGIATLHNYHIESSSMAGTPVSAVLTAVGDATNELSGTALALIKIDLTPPIASATYDGGFSFTDASEDALSGLSAIRYKTQIAFTTPVSDMNPPTTGWEDLDNHTMSTQGNYDVWVRATDKAGNEHTMKVFADLFVGGEVSITKETDVGAVLHEAICLNFESITLEAGCGSACSIGLSPEVAEESVLIYKLTLTNEAGTGSADGTFEDYLPEGVVLSTMPTVTPAGSATVNYVLETLPPFAGRYKVSGTYTGLAPGGRIEIDILTELPVFDGVTPGNNILVNQASTDWNINAGMLTGSNESNYATHEVVVAGVDTLFTKVGANDIAQGIAGVEFVLYRWDGAFAPTAEEQGHIVDYSVLVDNTLPGGDWVRVTYDGEEALALTDIFVSSASPLGEVDLGTLPEGIYTLIETKTSGGYALPMGQWILTIDPSKSDTGAGDWKIDFVGKSSSIAPPAAIRDESVPNAPTYKIVNAEPFLIGLSGLEGTTGVLLTGFIIMAIAANTYLVRRHKQREKQEAQEGQSL